VREFDDARTDVLLDPTALIAETWRCLSDLGEGRAHQAPKQKLPAGRGGFFLALAGTVPRLGLATAKWASYVPAAPGRAGVSTSTIVASDAETGTPLALITGMRATHLRTAASALVGVQAARPGLLTGTGGRFTLAFVGFGPTNRTVAELLLRTGVTSGLERIVVLVRSQASAQRIQDDPIWSLLPGTGVTLWAGTDPQAVTGARLVFSATGASTALTRLDALAEDGLAVSLDGQRTWALTEAELGQVLTDHPREDAPPAVAELVAGRRSAPTGRVLLDINGSAVADVAVAAVLLGDDPQDVG